MVFYKDVNLIEEMIKALGWQFSGGENSIIGYWYNEKGQSAETADKAWQLELTVNL